MNQHHHAKLLSPLHIGDTPIPFATTMEHVGFLRSVVAGKLPHIQQRMVNHKRSLGMLLSMGMYKRHRANTIATLRAETIFATPVLFSGMASLFLTKFESNILAHHVKDTTQNLLKLHCTPDPVVFFLAGSLPGETLRHLKMLTLFGMICHLPVNIIHDIAVQLLNTSSQTNKNIFANIRTHCFTYNLHHPLILLKDPPSKESFKTLLNITDIWQSKLCAHTASLEEKSLKYFKPQ